MQDEWWRDYLTKTSSFSEWLQYHNHKASLEHQVELASRLYDQAQGVTEQDGQTIPEIIQDLRNSPLPQTATSLVSWNGIQASWFVEVFCQSPYMKLLQEFGCELWFVRKVCIIEIIRQWVKERKVDHAFLVPPGPFVSQIGSRNQEGESRLFSYPSVIVSPATRFISYTGGYTLRHLVQVLTTLPPEDYIWMDIFCVDQVTWTGKKGHVQVHEFAKILMNDLQRQIKRIGKTALVLEKLNDVMRTLKQIWVLWEIFCTAEAGADLVVLLSQAQLEHFVTNCIESVTEFKTIQQSLSKVDANNGKAENDHDRTVLLHWMRKQGLSNVNSIVVAKMREWLTHVARSHLERMRRRSSVINPAHLNNVALLLDSQQHFAEAEVLYREALERRHQWLTNRPWPSGNKDPSKDRLTFLILDNLSTVLQLQGKFEEAEALCRQALNGRRAQLGSHHVQTLSSISSMAELCRYKGKLNEAEVLHGEVLKGRRRKLGNQNPDTLASMNNLAEVLRCRGKLSQSERLFRESLEGLRQRMGKYHPHTLMSINNFAKLKQDQGDLKEAASLLREAISGLRQQYGDCNFRTLTAMSNLGDILRLEKNLGEETESLICQAVEHKCRLMGDRHPLSLRYKYKLALLYRDRGEREQATELLKNVVDGLCVQPGIEHEYT